MSTEDAATRHVLPATALAPSAAGRVCAALQARQLTLSFLPAAPGQLLRGPGRLAPAAERSRAAAPSGVPAGQPQRELPIRR